MQSTRLAALSVAMVSGAVLWLRPPTASAEEAMDFEMEGAEEEGSIPPVEVADPEAEEPPAEVEPEPEPEVAAVVEPEAGPSRQPAYAFAVAAEEELEPAAAELGRTMIDLLAGDPRFTLSPAEGRMHGLDPASEEALSQAEELFEGARASYDNLELDEAIERFEQALATYEEQVAHLPDIAPLSDCLLYIGAAQVLSERSRTARTTFERLLVIDPERRPSEDVFPPTVVEVFDYVAGRMGRVPTGSVAVTTDPAGADVYVDGVLVGPSPQTLSDLKEGRHYVRARLSGRVEVGRVVEVRGRRPVAVSLALDPSDDGPVVAELVSGLPGQILERPDDVVGTVQRLGEILGVELLAVAYLIRDEQGLVVRLTAWDVLRGEPLATQTAGPFESSDAVALATAAAPTVDSLLEAATAAQRVEQAVDVPIVRPRPTPPPPPPPSRPFWQQWWFWTVVGVAVVGAGVGIGFGVAEATSGPERTNGELILDL